MKQNYSRASTPQSSGMCYLMGLKWAERDLIDWPLFIYGTYSKYPWKLYPKPAGHRSFVDAFLLTTLGLDGKQFECPDMDIFLCWRGWSSGIKMECKEEALRTLSAWCRFDV